MIGFLVAALLIIAAFIGMYVNARKHPKPDWLTEDFRRENRGV